MSNKFQDLGLEYDPLNSQDVVEGARGGGGPKWKQVAPNLFPRNKLESMNNKLKKVEQAIEKINSKLEQAEAVVEALAALEQAITDPFTSLVDTLVSEIDTYLNNLSSTGVYLLDSVSPYIIGTDLFQKNKFATSKEEREFLTKTLVDFDYAGNTSPFENENEFGINQWLTLFKPVTYDEWIEEIADAFIDPYDLPDGQMEANYFVTRNDGAEVLGVGTGSSESLKFETLSNYDPGTSTWSRPGAPKWGEASQSTVFVLALVLPNLSALAGFIDQFIAFARLFPFIGNDTFSKNLKERANDSVERLQNDLGIGGEKDSWKELLNTLTANEEINGRMPISGGSGLDFYGVTLGSLFPSIFNLLRSLNAKLNALTKKIAGTISGFLEEVLDGISDIISTITDFINFIDDIVQFLRTIANLDLVMLRVSSRRGVNDIYNQLLEATGFPSQEDQRKQIILGITLAAGAPGPDVSGFNFGKYVADLKKTYNEDEKSIKKMYKGDSSDGGQEGLSTFMNNFK